MPLPDNIEIRGIKYIYITLFVRGEGSKMAEQCVAIEVKGGQTLGEIGDAVTRASFNALKVAIENACKGG